MTKYYQFGGDAGLAGRQNEQTPHLSLTGANPRTQIHKNR